MPDTTTPGTRRLLGWVVGLLVVMILGLVIVLVRLAALQDEVDRMQFLVGSQSDTVVVDDSVALDSCRLLGAIAAEQGISIADAFDSTTLGACESAAREGAAAAR